MSGSRALLLAVSMAGLLAAYPAVAGTDKAAARVAVAKVNGKTLYADQLEPLLRAQRQTRPKHGTGNPDGTKVAQQRAIEQLIDVELLSQQARRLEIPDLEAQVDARMAGWRQTQPAILTEQSAGEIRALLVEELRVEAYLREQGVADPEIPETAIRALYDRNQESFRREEAVRLRHISLQLPGDAPAGQRAETREILQRARQRLLAGSAFETAAEEVLHDPGGSQGDLGLLTRREMPEAIATAAFALSPGRISDVIDTPAGVHVVEVVERQPTGVAPYEEVKDFIRKYLQEGRSRQVYRQLVQGLRQRAEIEILPEPG